MTASPLAPWLDRGGVVILDGGLATTLEAAGHDLRDELWSARLLADAPDAIRAVHEAFVAAGADCVVTASYQATLEGFARRGLDGAEMLRRSVRLARASGARLVAASVGPYGAARADGSEFTGDYGGMDEEALLAWHRPRWEVLRAAGADLLACETIPSLVEARALARLPDAWAWFSFTCRDGRHLRDGTPLADAVAAVVDRPRTAAVGVNCTAPEHVESLIREARRATVLPIVVYPNSGETWDAGSRSWRGRPADLAALAPRWRAAGASILGGCCRVGPNEIARMRAALLGP